MFSSIGTTSSASPHIKIGTLALASGSSRSIGLTLAVADSSSVSHRPPGRPASRPGFLALALAAGPASDIAPAHRHRPLIHGPGCGSPSSTRSARRGSCGSERPFPESVPARQVFVEPVETLNRGRAEQPRDVGIGQVVTEFEQGDVHLGLMAEESASPDHGLPLALARHDDVAANAVQLEGVANIAVERISCPGQARSRLSRAGLAGARDNSRQTLPATPPALPGFSSLSTGRNGHFCDLALMCSSLAMPAAPI